MASPSPAQPDRENAHIDTLLRLTLNPQDAGQAIGYVRALDAAGVEELLTLADAHHVTLRALAPVLESASNQMGGYGNGNGADQSFATLARLTEADAEERRRIQFALPYLSSVCEELEASDCPTTVMKSLDHWPDLGNDLDLYTTAPEPKVVKVMVERFNATIEPRSWGDRLAGKWNFAIAGLRESVEIHVQRLGQTGEHTALARRFVTRREQKPLGGYTFLVPAPEERVIVATLQRMYRHFYFRVCDIVNTAQLVDSGALDYGELRRASEYGGIWPGVAAYLAIVSDWVKRYRGEGLPLPPEVRSAAPFGGEKITVRERFLRVPIMPDGAQLYTRQVTAAAFHGDVPGTFRLSLLPPLATAAAIAYRITGSDKGIW
jgi:hypothetical protein